MTMKTHELKCSTQYFHEIWVGRKTFEIRNNDRGFEAPCVLNLREVEPVTGKITGRSILAACEYVLRDFEGLRPGYVGLSLRVAAKEGAPYPHAPSHEPVPVLHSKE